VFTLKKIFFSRTSKPISIKLTLHVFMCKILANMTQVSDVAPGPLVFYKFLLLVFLSVAEVSKNSIIIMRNDGIDGNW
jgi:hypothetical protein